VKIKEYLESGILEAYVLGSASEAETRDLLYLKAQYPEVQEALDFLEIDMERIAQHMAIKPPPEVWSKIENNINNLLLGEAHSEALTINKLPQDKNLGAKQHKDNFIEVESASSHMRIHKGWRWVFAAVIVLWKIFLGLSLYFYFENRSVIKEVDKLKMELEQYQPH